MHGKIINHLSSMSYKEPGICGKLFILICFLSAMLALSSCAAKSDDNGDEIGTHQPPPELVVFENVDFISSPFKHINNGPETDSDIMPYNIDAITGATVTVEGAGVTTGIPLSMRELQNANDGLVRASYTDSTGTFVYEGLDLHYLLYNMTHGDKGIFLTDKAYSVRLKDSNRELLADITLSEIVKAHESGRPILLAYGIATADLSLVAPFVFNGAAPGMHSEGYIPQLGNDDGCLKLVLDIDGIVMQDTGGRAKKTDTFLNVAYIYVAEEAEPGFKHTASSDPVYNTTELTDYIISFRGDALGAEFILTTAALQDLVHYDADGNVLPGAIGFSDFYSLANNAYWYVNEYEGLDLYKLLLYLGMDDAETMGRGASRTTLVSFIADDGFVSPEVFSAETLSLPEVFGFYKKNAIDMDDGTYIPTSADLERTGFPVLLAYGVNGYPYTITKSGNGYLPGLSNDGGPVRVVFGKTQYNHANGSNQVKFLRSVIAGNDVLYNTHKYTDNEAHRAYASDGINISVINNQGQHGIQVTGSFISAGDLQEVIYGQEATSSLISRAGVKDHYEYRTSSGITSDIFEGISLEYFIMDMLGLPGTNGTVTFTYSDNEVMSINLDMLMRDGHNAMLGRGGITPIIAFAKNGSPLVPDTHSPGYIESIPLHPLSHQDPKEYIVDNRGGPLAVLIPSSHGNPDALSLFNVTSIEIELIPDAYAHLSPPYDNYLNDIISFFGDGLESEGELTVSDIISSQRTAETLDYSTISGSSLTMRRYRGVSVFELLIQFGVKANAGEVLVYDKTGNVHSFPLSVLRRSDYMNHALPGSQPLYAMLAYGTGIPGEDTMLGLPLVPDDTNDGYDENFSNTGGPLMLIIPQETAGDDNAALWVKNVAAIEVTAHETDSWGHAMSDIYSEFLGSEFTLTIRNDDSQWAHTFTIGELESMTDLVVREVYSVLDIGECEGIDIWRLIRRIAGDVPGIGNPVSITAFASDGYMNDLLSVFGMDAFELGVPDGDGNRKPLIIAYAINGLPLVDTQNHIGYTGLAGNTAGPLRIIAESNQGASVKYLTGITVVIPGSGAIDTYISLPED